MATRAPIRTAWVVVRDLLKNTDATVAASETFHTLRQAGYGEVLRGFSLTPGSDVAHERHDYDHGYDHDRD
jgi:hypothetical protein